MNKKVLSKILMSVLMVSIFLLPIQPSFKINKKNLTINTAVSLNEVKAFDPINNIEDPEPLDLGCGVFSIGGCVAVLFWVIFKIVAWVASFAGTFLDFLVYYSTNSGSYTSTFVNKGWGAIRDVANIFFIIALLYIAIKTILSLNVTNNKKLIGTIVIVALLINFSLFFSQVIIDGSNILAKVFYNNIDQKYTNGNAATGPIGQKSISVGLMDKFNPEKLLDQKTYNAVGGTTLFIIITVILIAMIVYTAFIFFSVGLLFVSRVVMLWFCMIFAPIAFASYTLPFDIPGLGHKEWWKYLLENAFLAPLFIFMLYIIVMFSGFLKEITTFDPGSDIMQKIMAVMIPFVILMVLLKKAKELAVKYAGEMGAAVVKGGQMIGGVALGAAAGGLAIAGRAGFGRLGNAVANSEWAKERERQGKFGGVATRNLAKAAGKGSFDVRGIKVMGKDLSSTGMKVGKAQEGGFEKRRADKTEKRQKRAKELEAGPDSQLVKDVRDVEIAHQDLVGKYASEIERLDKTIDKKRQGQLDARNKLDALKRTHADPAAIATATSDYATLTKEFNNAKNEKTALVKGRVYEEEDERGLKTGKKVDYSGAVSANGRTIDQLETEDLAKAQKALKLHNFNIRKAYAETLGSDWNIFANAITSGLQHSNAGLEESIHKIRMDVKLDSGTKTH